MIAPWWAHRPPDRAPAPRPGDGGASKEAGVPASGRRWGIKDIVVVGTLMTIMLTRPSHSARLGRAIGEDALRAAVPAPTDPRGERRQAATPNGAATMRDAGAV